jgi:hypothetical protein
VPLHPWLERECRGLLEGGLPCLPQPCRRLLGLELDAEHVLQPVHEQHLRAGLEPRQQLLGLGGVARHTRVGSVPPMQPNRPCELTPMRLPNTRHATHLPWLRLAGPPGPHTVAVAVRAADDAPGLHNAVRIDLGLDVALHTHPHADTSSPAWAVVWCCAPCLPGGTRRRARGPIRSEAPPPLAPPSGTRSTSPPACPPSASSPGRPTDHASPSQRGCHVSPTPSCM